MNTQPTWNTPITPRKQSKNKRPSGSRQHRLLTMEISLKLSVYSLLSIASITAIIKLLPYQQVQQEKLAEIRSATEQVETRVNYLREDFNRNFDPIEARQVMQEQSPEQSQISVAFFGYNLNALAIISQSLLFRWDN